jgi:RNA polymerase sigma-70 factor (ECF subfamily)
MTRLSEDQKEATDEMLMVRYQRGQRDAFASLVARHATTIFSVSYYLLGNETQADKLAQDTFLQVVREAATFHLEAQFRTWVFGLFHVVSGKYCSEIQLSNDEMGNPLHSDSSETFGPESVPPTSSRSYRSQILARRVANRVATLPIPMREVFLYKQTGQLSLQNIATATGTDVDTVRHLLRAAFDRIQECVADTEEYARALR